MKRSFNCSDTKDAKGKQLRTYVLSNSSKQNRTLNSMRKVPRMSYSFDKPRRIIFPHLIKKITVKTIRAALTAIGKASNCGHFRRGKTAAMRTTRTASAIQGVHKSRTV